MIRDENGQGKGFTMTNALYWDLKQASEGSKRRLDTEAGTVPLEASSYIAKSDTQKIWRYGIECLKLKQQTAPWSTLEPATRCSKGVITYVNKLPDLIIRAAENHLFSDEQFEKIQSRINLLDGYLIDEAQLFNDVPPFLGKELDRRWYVSFVRTIGLDISDFVQASISTPA